MANIGLIYYNVLDYPTNTYITNLADRRDIYIDIVKGKTITKLGVQAPPGTKMIVNGNKEVMVGRTGMYELENGIIITALKFVLPVTYIKAEGPSELLKRDGLAAMRQAKLDRAQALVENGIAVDALDRPVLDTDEKERIYERIESEYVDAYRAGLEQYALGVHGVYEEGEPGDLLNIIVDYIYEA